MMEALPNRLPLVIGVTGHRDLRDEDVPRLEQEVAAIIATLQREYFDGDQDSPIIVLSALAEGADRLVARVALKAGARLIAPLPMPLEEYRRDFDPGLKAGNMAEFNALLAQAIAAPVMPVRGTSLEAIREDRGKRAEQYRAVGIFITQHCHVLLALWDGDSANAAAGGSAEVVGFKRDGIPLYVSGSPRASLDASEVGPVIEIITPRAEQASHVEHIAVRPWGRAVLAHYRGDLLRRFWRSTKVFVGHFLHREIADPWAKLPAKDRRALETWEKFEALIDLNRKFNRDAEAQAAGANGRARLAKSLDSLFTYPPGGKLDADAKAKGLRLAPLWCGLYAVADTLALERQLEFKWDWIWLFGLGFAAFFCFAMFTHAGYVYVPFLVAYLAIFVAGIFVHSRAVRRQDQERYLDYRALAEALRVAVYWKLLGIGPRYFNAKSDVGAQDQIDTNPVGVIANAYPIKQPNELAWVKVCLRTLERLDTPEGGSAYRIDPGGHAIARRFWVEGQFEYFREQRNRHNELAECIKARSDVLLLASAFLLVPVLIYMKHYEVDVHWHKLGLEHGILIVVGLLPGVAAVLTGYSERLGLKAQARQYDRMQTLFGRAHELLPPEINADTMALAYALYHELGMEAMKENAEWVAIYRQRPIEPLK